MMDIHGGDCGASPQRGGSDPINARGDLQSTRFEYKHLQCVYRITNPDIPYIGIDLVFVRHERLQERLQVGALAGMGERSSGNIVRRLRGTSGHS